MFSTSWVVKGEDTDDSHEQDTHESSDQQVDNFSPTDAFDGKPGRQTERDGLMHTVLESEQEDVDMGHFVNESVNNNVTFFTPNVLMEKLVNDYRSAKQLYGETLLRTLTGYDNQYLERNIRIPEFQRQLQEDIKDRMYDLEEKGILDKEGHITPYAYEVAAAVLLIQELDHLSARGLLGERVHRKASLEGSREETKPFRRGDPYKSLNIAQSIKVALRRGHDVLDTDDLRTYEREARGKADIIYAVDSSGSMKGGKINQAKRAGIALSFKAIEHGDNVGIVVFGKEVEASVPPCRDFRELLNELSHLHAGQETNITEGIRHATTLFKTGSDYQHLMLLTDALPTVGAKPEEDVLGAVGEAVAAGITVSVIGIALDTKGEELARRIVDIGGGRLSIARDVEELDMIVLEDYENIRSN